MTACGFVGGQRLATQSLSLGVREEHRLYFLLFEFGPVRDRQRPMSRRGLHALSVARARREFEVRLRTGSFWEEDHQARLHAHHDVFSFVMESNP